MFAKFCQVRVYRLQFKNGIFVLTVLRKKVKGFKRCVLETVKCFNLISDTSDISVLQ